MGNSLLYLGSGCAAVAGGISLIGSKDLANIFLFVNTVCFAGHVTLIGCAKCSSREEDEREDELADLAKEVGFRVTTLKSNVVDDWVNASKDDKAASTVK